MNQRLRFRMSSMQHTDTGRQKRSDLTKAIPDVHAQYRPDFIGFTELDKATHKLVEDRCVECGYELVTHSSVGVAVRGALELVETGWVNVLDPLRSPTGRGSYARRGVLEVTVLTAGGLLVTVHMAHWITDAPTISRTGKRYLQSQIMAERVTLHGMGRRIAFWMGDTNEDEGKPPGEVQRPLEEAGLISLYDALGKYPDTHGAKTIDVIGHYRKDRRVLPRSVEVGEPRNSDHRVVDGVYQVVS